MRDATVLVVGVAETAVEVVEDLVVAVAATDNVEAAAVIADRSVTDVQVVVDVQQPVQVTVVVAVMDVVALVPVAADVMDVVEHVPVVLVVPHVKDAPPVQAPAQVTVTPHVQVAVTNPVHPVQVVVPTTV